MRIHARLWERICRDSQGLHETLGEDLQEFVRICETLGEDSQGFVRLWERI